MRDRSGKGTRKGEKRPWFSIRAPRQAALTAAAARTYDSQLAALCLPLIYTSRSPPGFYGSEKRKKKKWRGLSNPPMRAREIATSAGTRHFFPPRTRLVHYTCLWTCACAHGSPARASLRRRRRPVWCLTPLNCCLRSSVRLPASPEHGRGAKKTKTTRGGFRGLVVNSPDQMNNASSRKEEMRHFFFRVVVVYDSRAWIETHTTQENFFF